MSRVDADHARRLARRTGVGAPCHRQGEGFQASSETTVQVGDLGWNTASPPPPPVWPIHFARSPAVPPRLRGRHRGGVELILLPARDGPGVSMGGGLGLSAGRFPSSAVREEGWIWWPE